MVGFMMLTGRMNWRFGATVIIGCFILFGAGAIVSGIQSAAAAELEPWTLDRAPRLSRPDPAADVRGRDLQLFHHQRRGDDRAFLITRSFLALPAALVVHVDRLFRLPARAARSSTCGSPRSAVARASGIGSAGAATATRHERKAATMAKWLGPAAWSKKEAKAGDRLPYARHVDDRDAAAARRLADALAAGARLAVRDRGRRCAQPSLATRDVMLRSALDARFVLYHHVIRRRVEVELGAQYRRPVLGRASTAAGATSSASGQLFVNEQFVTLVRRPAAGQGGLPERLRQAWRQAAGASTSAEAMRPRLRATRRADRVALQSYGVARARQLRDRARRLYSELLELLSALYNGEMRPVLLPRPEQDLGQHLPYRGSASASTRSSCAARAQRGFAAHPRHQGISRREPRRACSTALLRAAVRDGRHRELRADRAADRARADRPRRSAACSSADEGAATERAEMLAARDAVGAGPLSFGDHHLTVLVRSGSLETLDERDRRLRPPRSPTSARSRCARTSTSSRRSGGSSPATSNMSSAAR